MTTQTAPVVPPRPSRSPQQQGLTPDMPRIPPRPSRRAERSVSPLRDSYAPSPLNEPPNGSALHPPTSAEVPQRPPSVTIPSLGEEGIEYEDLNVNNVTENHHSTPAETRNVGSDLKLHAPRPSLPTSSAKAKVQAVTRTDSRSAAAAGLGRAASPTPDESTERPSRSLHSRASGSRADSSIGSTDRRQSFNGDEHGIPEIGQRVPMYPNAGDVQAPSPSPYQLEHGSQRPGRSHNRSRSGRESSLPPGSYGLHGHGVTPNDRFEKAWYEKHPEEYAKEEQGQYGPGVGTPRPDWALSSDDLNKIVRGSAVTGSGLGTSPAVDGTPEEEVGYIASDEYTQRLASPAPDSRRNSRPVMESPLRNEKSSAVETQSTSAEAKEEPAVIHVDEPYHHLHHPDGFAQTPDPSELVHAPGEAEDEEDEPILAADEVRPESAYQHPAVSPTFGRPGSIDHDRSRTPSVSHSRSNSRTASHHGSMPTLARYDSREERDTHTPLEDVEEYEPLFPEDGSQEKKPLAERFKQRPDVLKHRFPSEDIWEDSPNSLQLHATVSTPDERKHETFETPEQESFRRSHVPHLDPHKVASQILESEDQEEKEKEPSRFELAKQRFPSRDIWEDAPESHTLVTTIEPSDDVDNKSPIVPTKPIIPSRPQKRGQPGPPVDASTKPASPTEKRQPPTIPDRPKPQIPARPSKPAGLNGEETSDAAAKAKPPVPARPGGSKIAALKAGFLSDLNSRLQLGPQVPQKPQKKEEEPPAEKAPLSDARKGRARGPARRRPAVEPVASKLPTIPEIRITESWNVWQVCEDGNLVVGSGQKSEQTVPEPASESSPTMAPPLSKNMAGEPGEPTDPLSSPEQEKGPSAVTDTPAAPAPATASTEEDAVVPAVPVAEEDVPSCARPETKPTPSSSEVEVEDTAEAMAASADGKRSSEGDVKD
ncbi:altered inheritance of mitochondria protein 21 [Aspergillus ambiguus]|uniref:Aim21 family protein n=1 Tax=Aspergillus ambiguus TaxID=176160 RepID=UPI003CCDEAA1